MVRDLGLKWKTVRHQDDVYVNSERNIQLRKIFALKINNLLERKKILLNFDESIIDSTTG